MSQPPHLIPSAPTIVIELMKKVAIEREAAVIVVTHDEKIFSRLDRMVHLRDGRIVDA